MSRFSLEDRVRSLRRFVIAVYGSPPWTVRLAREPIAEVNRPVALIESATPVGPGSRAGRVSMDQGPVEKAQSFAITLYPSFTHGGNDGSPLGGFSLGGGGLGQPPASAPVLGGEQMTAAEAAQEARRVAQRLDEALTHGLTESLAPGEAERWLWVTGPYRLPIFDFDGVPIKGATSGPDEPYGWMWVEDCPVRPVPDPEDVARWTVVSTLRVSWLEGGRLPAAAPAVTAVGPGQSGLREPVGP